jgi:tetratricopeptide (TPR) repeat protein
MKKHLITAIFAVLATVASAQSNYGKDYFGIGEYDAAKAYFEKQVAQSPAESNYYLGEIAWAEGKVDDAKAYFEKGIAADPLYSLNYIGKGKTMLKSNQKEAELIFATTLKKAKKDVEVNVAIARAYYENGMKDIVPLKLEIARKIGKESPLVYIFEGDMLAADQKYGDAAGKYDQALYFDAKNTVAALKCARVYESINSALSVEKVKSVIAAHPDYTIAYRYLGRSYSQGGFYPNAIEAFKTYFAEGNYTIEDITSFASAYYFTDQFGESIKLLDEGLAKDSTNFVLNRLRMYNASKVKDGRNGVNIANRFFSLNGKFIYQDYLAYAGVLSAAGMNNEALEQYNKVIATEGAKPEFYKEMAPVYTKMGDNVKAAETFQKYIDLVGGIDVAEGADYYSLGKAWYSAGQAQLSDSTEIGKATRMEYFIKADSAFATVSAKSPESHIGYLWRGNANVGMDPETLSGLAKPYYEQALNILLTKVKDGAPNGYRRDLIMIYRYLAYYYYVKEDKENCILNSNKILELDPNNAVAKQLIESFNPQAKVVKTTKKED